jgi:hypothetical protein
LKDGNHADEREPYTAPRLTRHGSLEELTQGAGSKAVEKGSAQDEANI